MGGFPNTLATYGDVAVISNNKGPITLDAEDAVFFESHNIYIQVRDDCVTVTARCKSTGKMTKLSRLIVGAPAGAVVDHIDGNPLNNRKANLRVVSQQDNRRNSIKPRVPSTSAYKGVCKPSGRTRWSATIYDRKMIRLGSYATEEEAARAYDKAARRLFGECAALNFPQAGEQSAHRPCTLTEARDAIDAQLSKLRPAA